MIEEQGIFNVEAQREKILKNLKKKLQSKSQDEEKLENIWNDSSLTSREKWNKSKTVKGIDEDRFHEVVFTYLYPRLDANVSKGINHLLKSPWCVHPKTGKICVPFNPEHVDSFNPNECPTLSQALNEYNRNLTQKVPNPAEVPCLKKALAVFKTFISTLDPIESPSSSS
jgi:DNA primase small subunit